MAKRGRVEGSGSISPEDGADDVRRRQLHNESEQRRARRIKEQIDILKEVLVDRFAILFEATKRLQDLQDEVQRLKAAQAAAQRADAGQRSPPIVSHDPSVVVASPVDYASIFKGGQVPQVISDLQGRFIDCNQAFIDLTGWPKSELLALTMFTITPPSEVSTMASVITDIITSPHIEQGVRKFSKQCLFKHGTVKADITMCLVRDQFQRPKYFSCYVMPPSVPESGSGLPEDTTPCFTTSAAASNPFTPLTDFDGFNFFDIPFDEHDEIMTSSSIADAAVPADALTASISPATAEADLSGFLASPSTGSV